MLSVRDMMISDPVVVAPDSGIDEAARIMRERKINSVVVVDDGHVRGVLTPRDLMTLATDPPDGDVAVRDLMTPDPFTIAADAGFDAAEALMTDRRIRHLPVIDDDRLVGMLSVRDLMLHRTRHLETLVDRQTSTLRHTNDKLRKRERTMQYHLDLAGRIQRQLLPHQPPRQRRLSVGVHYRPLEAVSGDCYDFVELPDGRIGILIADASGHGVPAAFISVVARMLFQAYGHRLKTPTAVLEMMNEQLPALIEEEHFVTMCHAAVDPERRTLVYATGGHPPPLVYRRADDEVTQLPGCGHMIGILDDPSFSEQSVTLDEGDVVLLFTDGVFETRNLQEEQFGVDRLSLLLKISARQTSQEIAAGIGAKVLEHCGPRGPGDDMTCIALKVE